MSLLDVVDRVRAVAVGQPEPAGITVDDSCAEPLAVEALHIYAFDTSWSLRSTETGPPSEERFEVLVAYVHAVTDEEALQQPAREVTLALSAMRDEWLTRLAEHESNETWQEISARAEYEWLRTFGVRGIAVRCSGFRYI